MLRDLAIPDFLDKLNSSEPTPGGGGCAPLNWGKSFLKRSRAALFSAKMPCLKRSRRTSGV